jgi:AcrR family transcriptional regulator
LERQTLKAQIAASLEAAFSQYGFAEVSVSQLKTACNVSLRTLYKHYPSKESMIVAALTHRHQRYLTFLADPSVNDGKEAILAVFERLNHWMAEFAPHGCMSLQALAAFPDNLEIKAAVSQHKNEVRILLGQQAQRPDLATALLLLHEGVSNVWPILGRESIESAKFSIQQMTEQNEHA